MESPYRSVRDAYVDQGARQYYEQSGRAYRNPHEPTIRQLIATVVRDWPLDLTHVLDLAAGSGEVTLALQAVMIGPMTIDAVDPFTFDGYADRVGRACEAMSFEDVAAGALSGRSYSLVICSFALHLAESSRLPSVCMALAEVSPALLILTPHKRPVIQSNWGWTMTQEVLIDRVRARLYRSSIA